LTGLKILNFTTFQNLHAPEPNTADNRNTLNVADNISKGRTCSNPGSLWYGFSFIRDCIDIRRLERLRAGLQAGPDHVLYTQYGISLKMCILCICVIGWFWYYIWYAAIVWWKKSVVVQAKPRYYKLSTTM